MSAPSTELKVFDPVAAEITKFVSPALTVKVSSAEVALDAHTAARQVKALEKAVETKRVELVGPLNAQVKMINEYAKTLLNPLSKVESHLKGELINWERKLAAERQARAKELEDQRRKQEQEQREREAAEKRKVRLSSAFAAPDASPPPTVDTTELDRQKFEQEKVLAQAEKENADNRVKGVRKVWTFKVTDPDKVPRNFLMVNDSLIRTAVGGGAREIPGVEIYEEDRMSIR